MSEIKSAWEIALERTKDIQGDKDTLKSSERKNDGKRLASAFLNPAEDMDEKAASGKIKSYSGKDQAWIREGFFGVMSANLNLPIDDTFAAKLEMLEKGLQLVIKEKKQVSFIFEQISQFFDQYLQGREQMLEALKQQYEPQLREKERVLEQQMGAKVNLTPEQDPEFVTLLSKNYARLEEQYANALRQAKEQLQQMFDSSQ